MNTNNNTTGAIEQINQLKEIKYFSQKSKRILLEKLNDNRKFEFLIFNLYKTRSIIYNILQENYNRETNSYLHDADIKFLNQYHAINNLIGVLIEGTKWEQGNFINNEPKGTF